MRTTLKVMLLCSVLPALPASAQTVTVPSRVAVGCAFVKTDATKDLTKHYLSGDRAAFRTHAAALVEAVTKAPDCAAVAAQKIDLQRDVLLVLWVDTDPLGKDDVVYHAIVQKDDPDPFSTVLPGVAAPRRAFELFFSAGAKDAVASAYRSTRERDPIEQQLPAFAQAIFDPLAALLASTQGSLRSAPPPGASVPAGSHYASVSQIVLPFARAAVHVEVRVAVAPDADAFKKDIAKLSTTNAFVTAAHSACGRDLNTRLQTATETSAAACTLNPATCALALTSPFSTAYQAAVATCNTDTDRRELLAVDTSYRDLVTAVGSAKISGAFDLKNSPRKLVSLGLLAVFAFKGGVVDATRVKVDDGNIVADPLDRRMSLVVVNIGFKPYNADAFHPTPQERYQWFVGAVVTPDFGVAAGLSAGIVRGLSVNFGGAILGVRGKHPDDELGTPPKHGSDPFELAMARTLFIGVGYNFK